MTESKDSHVCSVCSATFNRASRLEVHQRSHTGERPYSCECGKTYRRSQHLKRHQISCASKKAGNDETAIDAPILKEPKTYSCMQCNAGPFRQKKMVWAHIAMVHRERKHVCAQCSQAFPTRSKLTRHASKHHGFVCSLCYPVDLDASESPVDSSVWKFDSFIAFRRHMAAVHPKPTLQCPTCSQRFSRPKALAEHELTHTPGGPQLRRQFVCPLCPKVARDANAPNSETQSTAADATDDSRTGANMNGVVAFTVKRNLHAHMRAVHANRLFACNWPGCPVLLSTKQKLMQHVERHTTGRPVAACTRGPRNRLKSNSPVQRSKQEPESSNESDAGSETASQSSVVALLMRSDNEDDECSSEK